jgi:hypothetical protein
VGVEAPPPRGVGSGVAMRGVGTTGGDGGVYTLGRLSPAVRARRSRLRSGMLLAGEVGGTGVRPGVGGVGERPGVPGVGERPGVTGVGAGPRSGTGTAGPRPGSAGVGVRSGVGGTLPRSPERPTGGSVGWG